METLNDHHDQLRAWARGATDIAAAVELLIRAFDGRFAARGNPWVITEDGRPWINFESLPDYVASLSGGEQRFLLLTASLGGGPAADLSDFAMLDYERQDLMLRALQHAGGRPVWS